MAQQDASTAARNGSSVNEKVAKAKSVLADANRRFPGMGHAPAPKPVAAAPKPAMKPASAGQDVASGLKWNIDQAKAAVPKMHKGGPVKKDGVYSLKAGEHVLTADEANRATKHALMASGMKSLTRANDNAGKTPKGDNNRITVEPAGASALPKPKYGLPTDNRARQMKPGKDIKTT